MMFALAISLVLALAAPQQAPPQQPEPKLVYLNVIAVDSHGEPVTDLTSDEFQIADARKSQKIAFFRHRDVKPAPAPSLQPNQFSNRTGSNPSHATVILFDLLNERLGTRGQAWDQLIHFLEGLETADDLYLYFLTVDGRLYTVRGFAEGGAGGQDGTGPWTRQIKPLMAAAMHDVARVRPPEIDVNLRVDLTYRALGVLALDLARFPGRKNIVWITDGIPIEISAARSDTGDWVDFTPQLRQYSEALARSGVAIYPVQQIMLGSPEAMGVGENGDSGAGLFGGSGGLGRGGRANVPVGAGMGSLQSLDEFAGLTGGRLSQGKDVGAAIKESRNDSRTNYQIGYFPPPQNWDGKFHKLRITCKRKGVRIQAKTGYYAWAEAPETETRQALDAAASANFDAEEIGLRLSTSPNPVSPNRKDPQIQHFSLHIDANDIALAHVGAQYNAQLRVATIGYLADGRNENSSVFQFSPHYSVQERDNALKDGIAFAQDMKVGPGVRSIRFIVFDRGSGAIGSITIPVNTAAHLP
jgi:VWFA-related protein